MQLPGDRRLISLVAAALFGLTALALQLALHFIDRSNLLAGAPGAGLMQFKAMLFCVATGVLVAVDLSLLAALRRTPARPLPAGR